MNINQAKAMAGIKYKLATREDYSRAERDCVKLIVSARKTGDDARAAELSAAKTVFQKRSRGGNYCIACGVTISRGAIHCRFHSRTQIKMVGAPDSLNQSEKRNKSGNNNARVAAFPQGGRPAMLGFYSAPIRKVVAKHLAEIGIDNLKTYFEKVARPVIYGCPLFATNGTDLGGSELEMTRIDPRHWLAIFELGVAIAKLYSDKQSIESWLIKQPYPIDEKLNLVSFAAKPWGLVVENIKKRGGPRFSENQLKQAAKKMMLLTPRKTAAHWRKAAADIQKENPNAKSYFVVS